MCVHNPPVAEPLQITSTATFMWREKCLQASVGLVSSLVAQGGQRLIKEGQTLKIIETTKGEDDCAMSSISLKD